AAAASLHRDAAFNVTFDGSAAAQPLFVERRAPADPDRVIVATLTNHVTAFDADSGQRLWDSNLGPPAPRACPSGAATSGIVGTPAIDPATRTLYVNAYVVEAGASKHKLHALSVDDGMPLRGWPIDVNSAAPGFDSSHQFQRPALALINGIIYVAYGGH